MTNKTNTVERVDKTIDERCTIDEVIAKYPASVFVLNAMGIDTCCGGSESIAAAAKHAHVNPDLLLSSLQAAVRA